MTYEITDHLGNVRALLRDNISVYTPTMEDNGNTDESNPRNEENAYFQNIEETVVTDARMNHTEATPYGTPDKAAYLFWNDTQGTLMEEKAIGPAIALRVQPGDNVEIETWSRFERKSDYTQDFGLVALSALLGNTFSASGGFEGFTINNTISNLEGALTAGAFPDDGGDDSRPFAYVNYIIYDEDMVYQSAGWRRVIDDAGFYPEEIGLPGKTPVRVAFGQPITINESGYIYVWVSNQSKETRVWFDDLKVTHTQNIVVQATDYGVWGDVLREQKTDESVYRFGYQGQFAEKDEETGWNHFELREYDSVIGRWTVPDPYGQYWSPYLALGNNPVNRVDPDGGCDNCPSPGELNAAGDATWGMNANTGQNEWVPTMQEVTVSSGPEPVSFSAALVLAATRVGPTVGKLPTGYGKAIAGAAIVATAIVIHQNSNNNNDPHLVYEIFSTDFTGTERTEKYGITSREDEANGNNNRPAYQANKFNREDPTRLYSWRTVTRTKGRLNAKAIEVFLVTKHVFQHRGMPPKQIYPLPVMGGDGNIVNPTIFKF